MMASRVFTVILAAILVSLAGCGYVPQGETVHISLYGDDSRSDSDLALDPLFVSDSGVSIEGELHSGGGSPDKERYEDVSVILYADRDAVLCSRDLGEWDGLSPVPVSISVDSHPHYIIIHSPDFWDEPIVVEYFEYDEGQGDYQKMDASSLDELPARPQSANPCEESDRS